jgi:hypothetical protein
MLPTTLQWVYAALKRHHKMQTLGEEQSKVPYSLFWASFQAIESPPPFRVESSKTMTVFQICDRSCPCPFPGSPDASMRPLGTKSSTTPPRVSTLELYNISPHGRCLSLDVPHFHVSSVCASFADFHVLQRIAVSHTSPCSSSMQPISMPTNGWRIVSTCQ